MPGHPPSPATPPSVLELFLERGKRSPDLPLFTFVDEEGRDSEHLSCGQAVEQARAHARFALEGCGLRAGDRVVLVYPPSLDFIKSFLGCLLGGLIPVPVCPPDPTNPADVKRFAAICASASASAIWTNREYQLGRQLGRLRGAVQRVLQGARSEWPELPWHTTGASLARNTGELPALRAGPDDVALLQYTSGSTSAPKGVMITYGNLYHQLTTNAAELSGGPESRMAMWVPHFHDFGLISGILNATAGNGRLYMMSPLSFIKRPAVWLEVLSRVKATHTAAPDFAYDLVLRKTTPAQRAALDLSHLRVAMSAAEPVRARVVKSFREAFAPAGFAPDAFCPAYGLAEHTVGVSVFGRGVLRVDRDALEGDGAAREVQGEADGVELVACGAPSRGVRVRIVDPESLAVRPDGEVGEIWVDSPSKAAGYFGLPEETARTFQARVSGGGDSTGYLRTGDLGFLRGGQLYITGRLKDMIVVRGRNLYPQDLEESLRAAHPLVRPGGVVAFGIDNAAGQEQLAIIAEVRTDRPGKQVIEEMARALLRCVTENHALDCHTLILARGGVIQKTTSGKLQRREARRALVSGELQRHPDVLAVKVFERSAPAPRFVSHSHLDGRDVRLEGIDEELQQIVEASRARFEAATRLRGGRVFHQRATVLAGHLEVLEAPRLPPHDFFTPGRRLPVLARYANGMADDDALWDNRGATLRVLDPERPEALDVPLLDLLLTTGQRFPQGTAASFHRWLTGSAQERAAWLREHPETGEIAWEMLRAPTSYARLHYHSKVASLFEDAHGARWLARFRILPPGKPADEGFVDSGGLPMPPERMARKSGDARPPHFLHDELRARVDAGGVHFLLQLQLFPAWKEGSDLEQALDCTRSWPEDRCPWRDVARLHFERILPEEAVAPLRFNPRHAPPTLGMPLARSAHEGASLNHLRSVIYDLMADVRANLGATPRPSAAARPAPRQPERRLRVCVVGAGASGLTAARELERRGHAVTVLEKLDELGGKSASVELGGRAFDVGGHYCTDNYRSLGELVRELGIPIESATPGITLDLETGKVVPTGDPASMGEHFLRYARLRDQEFPELKLPGLARVAEKLADPVIPWLERHGLTGLGGVLEVTYTASGYDYLRGAGFPALYLLKAAETFVGADKGTGLPRAWTIAGGFAHLWRRVADGLRDVRRGVDVQRITRDGAQVRVQTRDETLVFDKLIIATPLPHALEYLDAGEAERDLFGRIRHLDYYTTLCTVSGLPRQGFYLLKQHCTDPSTVGHCVAFHHRYADSDVTLFYSYGNANVGPDEVVRLLRQDVARLGGRVETVHLQRRWAYFPHFSSEDVAGGAYARLEALQGQRDTFYLNSVFNFELVECNVAYATALVERFFGPRPDAAAPATRAPAVAGARAPSPAEYLQHVVAEALQLGDALPPPGAELAHLGMDSIRAVEISTRITRDTGIELSPAALRHFPTLEELGQHLAEQLDGKPLPSQGRAAPTALAVEGDGGAEDEEWLVFPRPLEAPSARLLCFHYAGGSAEWFQGWAAQLPEGVELCAIQLPGRGRNGGRPHRRLDALVEELEERIAPLLDVPCAFFGHSMGAVIACTLAARLKARARPLPRHLFVSSLPAPSHYREGAPVQLLSDKELSRFSAGAELGALEPATRARLLARLRADLRLVDTWRRDEARPLDIPLTALGGSEDRSVPLESLKGWAALTTGGFALHQFPGGHLYPEQQLPALAQVLAPVLRELGREPLPGAALELDRLRERFLQRWRATPSSMAGASNLLDLCWMARARRQDGTGPRYPAALDLLLSRQHPDGALLEPSPHPLCNLATSLAMANTLLGYEAHGGAHLRPRIEALIAYAMRQRELLETGPDRANDSRSGRFHRFPGFWGGLVPVKEAEQLLAHGGAFLTAAQRDVLRRYLTTRPLDAGVDPQERSIDYARAFAGDAALLYLGEYLPDEAFRVPEAREQAHRLGGVGFSAAGTVRYCEVTDDEELAEQLGARLARAREGLWLEGPVLETAFCLKYLGQGGLDPRQCVPDQVEYLLGSLREEGIAFHRNVRAVECDLSAVAQLVCHTWGLPTKMPSRRLLHDWWNEQSRSYQTMDGRDVYAVSVVMHVLGACLSAPDLTGEEKRTVWTRSLRLLEERPWVELYHLSPLYSWQQIIAFVGGNARAFPEHPTRAHHDALTLTVQLQQPCGGFQSHLLDAPNEEETGFALLAMKEALSWPRSRESWLELRHRVARAEQFLRARIAARQGEPTHPDLWMAKLSYAGLNVIESILLAGLSKPVPAWVPPG